MTDRSLDAAMDQRRVELGMEWKDVATDAGMSYETLRALRRGMRKANPLNIRRLEEVLRWEHGSVQAILDGGEPTPMEPKVKRGTRDDLVAWFANATPAEQDEVVAELMRAIREQRRAG